MQNSVMIKRSANQGIFLLLLSFFTLGNVVTGVLLGQDSSASPRPLAAAVLSRSYMVEHLDLETAAVQVRQALDPAEARVFLDRTKNQVVVKGTVGAHQLAAEMLRTIDRLFHDTGHGADQQDDGKQGEGSGRGPDLENPVVGIRHGFTCNG